MSHVPLMVIEEPSPELWDLIVFGACPAPVPAMMTTVFPTIEFATRFNCVSANELLVTLEGDMRIATTSPTANEG